MEKRDKDIALNTENDNLSTDKYAMFITIYTNLSTNVVLVIFNTRYRKFQILLYCLFAHSISSENTHTNTKLLVINIVHR